MKLKFLLPVVSALLVLSFFPACAGSGMSVNEDRRSTETVMQMRQFDQR
jgi:hypothetical protein